MNPIVVHSNLNLSDCSQDLLYAKSTINPSTNRYDIIFDCKNFTSIEKIVVSCLTNSFNENFDIYVKRFQSYIQTKDKNQSIVFERELMRGGFPVSMFSFIFFAKSENTLLEFKNTKIYPTSGDIVIFKSSDFISDTSTATSRLGLIGSVSNVLSINKLGTLI